MNKITISNINGVESVYQFRIKYFPGATSCVPIYGLDGKLEYENKTIGKPVMSIWRDTPVITKVELTKNGEEFMEGWATRNPGDRHSRPVAREIAFRNMMNASRLDENANALIKTAWDAYCVRKPMLNRVRRGKLATNAR